MYISPNNAGIPVWDSPTKNNNIPVHVQGPIGIVYNAQAEDGTDLIGWPFRAVGFVIMNPDFDNYLKALETEGLMTKDTAVIVMCASGWRSKYIADYLKTELGYNKVYNLHHGLEQWNADGKPVSTSESDWQTWDIGKLYDPARLALYGGAQWPNSVFLKGGKPVIPEWLGNYVPPTSMVGYYDPSCTAPIAPSPDGNNRNVGLNGPWPKDKAIADLNILPTLTSIAPTPAGWAGPTLNSMCIQTMMGFQGMDYASAVAACAGAPAVVPGYFNAWPIKKGMFIEGASLPIKGTTDDPCGDMFTDFFGSVWYPLQSYCEQRVVVNQMRTCNNPLDCVGSRDYCWAMPPFGMGGFAPVNSPDGKFWTPDLVFSVDFQFAAFSADLYISSVSAPASANSGQTISVSDTTNKSGASGMGYGTTTKIYLSTDNKYSASDTYLGSRAVGAFGVGTGSSAGSTSVTIPTNACTQTYYLIARADADNVVTEWNEGNNKRASAIAITAISPGTGVDLYVSSVTGVPGTLAVGAPLTVTDTTSKSGGCTAGASTTRVYLSSYANGYAGIEIGSGRAVPAFGTGIGSSSGGTSGTIPYGGCTGSCYIVVKADAGGAITEWNEGNNKKSVAITITP